MGVGGPRAGLLPCLPIVPAGPGSLPAGLGCPAALALLLAPRSPPASPAACLGTPSLLPLFARSPAAPGLQRRRRPPGRGAQGQARGAGCRGSPPGAGVCSDPWPSHPHSSFPPCPSRHLLHLLCLSAHPEAPCPCPRPRPSQRHPAVLRALPCDTQRRAVLLCDGRSGVGWISNSLIIACCRCTCNCLLPLPAALGPATPRRRLATSSPSWSMPARWRSVRSAAGAGQHPWVERSGHCALPSAPAAHHPCLPSRLFLPRL